MSEIDDAQPAKLRRGHIGIIPGLGDGGGNKQAGIGDVADARGLDGICDVKELERVINRDPSEVGQKR